MNTVTSCIRFLLFMGALWLLPGAAVYGADSSTALAAEAVENKAPPHGFYLLNSRGLPIERIRFPSFIRGYSLRAKWSDLEPAPGVYDFSEITRALQTLQSQGKQLSLSLMVSRVPAHIIRDASGTFELRPGQTVPLPWDPPSQQAYGRMLQALSATLVPDRSRGGALVPLREHSTLTMVNAPIIGLQGVRDLRGGVTRHPGYTRERFVESVLDCMEMSRQAFPKQHAFIAFFRIADSRRYPALDEVLYRAMRDRFGSGAGSKLGIFLELWSDYGPREATLGKYLLRAKDDSFTCLQALTSWTKPFCDPTKVASGSPEQGLSHAYRTYACRYFEIYLNDMRNPAFTPLFKQWSETLERAASP